MNSQAGHWWPVIASSAVRSRPVGQMRFGRKLVFWRSGGRVVCMPDRCPHRGAALSLGRVNDDAIACPFHGIEFSAQGHCVNVPVETSPRIPDDFVIPCLPVTESDGYVWLWTGAEAPEEQPALPRHPAVAGMTYGESTTEWPAHYTRCIENVCDFSHLPYVHRTTIGRGKPESFTQTEIEDVPGGFRAHLLRDGERTQCLEFLYPNLWLLMISDRFLLSAVFAPVDDERTAVFGRTYHRLHVPGTQWLANAFTRLSQFMVFREDWPIVASQTPGDVHDAKDEKLFPSDAPVMAYRKLLRDHQ
ncbi:MAG: Rieske 2Fe-2S domain-containing protein [Gammaproteobacteria bacterium]